MSLIKGKKIIDVADSIGMSDEPVRKHRIHLVGEKRNAEIKRSIRPECGLCHQPRKIVDSSIRNGLSVQSMSSIYEISKERLYKHRRHILDRDSIKSITNRLKSVAGKASSVARNKFNNRTPFKDDAYDEPQELVPVVVNVRQSVLSRLSAIGGHSAIADAASYSLLRGLATVELELSRQKEENNEQRY